MNDKQKINAYQQVANIRDWYPHYAQQKRAERRKNIAITLFLVAVFIFFTACVAAFIAKTIVSVLISL